jgi:hypothetical protein
MIRYLLPRIVLPLLAVLALEGLFRSNFWERFAAPDSHAGTSVRLKQAVTQGTEHIDFVTLGSSRAVYGLDHARIATSARAHGQVHANLSMPGSHWMSVTTVIDWLRSERPEVSGGIIALSVADMHYVGNGNYELAIVRPFQGLLGTDGHGSTRFSLQDPSSYGSISALHQYRGDIRDALLHPWQRGRAIGWYASFGQHQLFDGPRQSGDACAMPWDSLALCAGHVPVDDNERQVVGQCSSLVGAAGHGGDWSTLDSDALPPDRLEVLQQRQRELRAIGWKKPPLVILMPITHHWSRELMPKGAREWAHMVLDPLVAEGSIRLLDYSDFFDRDGITRCDVFWDLYHQNEKGLTELTDALLPEIESYLHDRR